MGPEGAVNIIYRRDLAQSPTPEERRQKLMEDYKARFANPYTAAERGYIDDVIVPHETRPRLIAALQTLQLQARTRTAAQARQHPAVTMSTDSAPAQSLTATSLRCAEQAAAIAAALEQFQRASGTAADAPSDEARTRGCARLCSKASRATDRRSGASPPPPSPPPPPPQAVVTPMFLTPG